MNKDLLTKLTNLRRHEIEYIIDQNVICIANAERNRNIFKEALINGVSQERIAEEYGLTPRQVRNIISDVTKIMLKHL